MIDGLLVLPREDPVPVSIDNDLKMIQSLVGGYIRCVSYLGQNDWTMLCDEDGKLKGLEPNFWYQGDIIVGPALFVGIKEDDFDSLSETNADIIKEVMPSWREKMRNRMGGRK